MIRRPPRSTRTYTLFPYTTLFRSIRCGSAFESLLWGNFVHPPTVMVRRRLFDQIGVFDETLRYNSDYDFIVRASRAGLFAFIEQPLLRYRISTTQMSHAAAGGKIPLETADRKSTRLNSSH